jgi:hypothetical protein
MGVLSRHPDGQDMDIPEGQKLSHGPRFYSERIRDTWSSAHGPRIHNDSY